MKIALKIDRLDTLIPDPEILLDLVLKFQGFQSKRLEVSCGEMNYYEKNAPRQGAQETLIFVHGIGANAGHYHQVLNLLNRAGYRILAPDLLCHGLSSMMKGKVNTETFYRSFVDWIEK